jgi:uncharacterized protein (DUF2062 family)
MAGRSPKVPLNRSFHARRVEADFMKASSTTETSEETTGERTAPATRGFLKRRIGDPVVALLKEGISPERLALSLAVGAALGLFPIVGATTLLCLLAGVMFRLNHPALQLVNYAVYPLQVSLILAFVRMGERLLGAVPVSLSPLTLTARFQQDPTRFLAEFGVTGLRGILGWFVVAPFVATVLYFVLVTPLRRVAAAFTASPLSQES